MRPYFQSQKLVSVEKQAKAEETKLISRLEFALKKDLPLQKTIGNKTSNLLLGVE